MLRLFQRKSKSAISDYVAASFANDGLCITAAKVESANDGNQAIINYLEFFPCSTIEQQIQTLVDQLQHQWSHPVLSINLNPGQYQLVNMEPPEVAWEDMRSAVQWSAKEMLDHNVDELYLDVFAVPEDAFRQQKKMIYIAALQKQYLQRLLTPLQAKKIHTSQVGIAELNLCAICQVLDCKGALAMLTINADAALLNISVNGELYLTRVFRVQKFDVTSLPQPAEQDDASIEEVFDQDFHSDISGSQTLADEDFYGDSLASKDSGQDYSQQLDGLLLDLQRSLDFFESQLGKGQVQTLALATCDTHGQAIGDYLSENLSCRLSSIPMTGITDLALDRREDYYRYLATIGACINLSQAETSL